MVTEARPSVDLDGWEDRQILDLAEKVREGWSVRDQLIKARKELVDKSWHVDVPASWRQASADHHSNLPSEIEARIRGTLGLRQPFFSRLAPDEDEGEIEKAETVERFFRGKFQQHRRASIPGKDAWSFQRAQIIATGAVCTGSLYAPNVWAGPLFMDGEEVRREWWRDSKGKPTDAETALDLEASARAYLKGIEGHRMRAGNPLLWRCLETQQCYPYFVEGRLLALFIYRKNALMDLQAGGFAVELDGSAKQLGRDEELLEVHTSNRARYYFGRSPITHKDFGEEGIDTNYGFVPFSYRTGLDGGSLEWGSYGLPLISLVDANIRTIDTLLTWQMHAVRMASFTSFVVEWEKTPSGDVSAVLKDARGNRLTTYQFKSGTIMDFGPGKKVVPLTHPGLNKDFTELLRFNIEEVHRIIPRTLQGQAESSGYNTAQATVQAKAILADLYDGLELHLEDLCILDMQHIAASRPPGPIYTAYQPSQGFASTPRKLRRVAIKASDVRDYFDMHVSIDREIDRITLSQHLNQLRVSGVGNKKAVAEAAGYEDWQEVEDQSYIEDFMDDPEVKELFKQKAIKRHGLEEVQREAIAMQRIQQDPVTGIPLVRLADGRMAGPGQPRPQTPQMQGGAGRMLGGANPASIPGTANLASTNNPRIALAQPTRTGRSRGRRRGGAIPGAPQYQRARPEPPVPV